MRQSKCTFGRYNTETFTEKHYFFPAHKLRGNGLPSFRNEKNVKFIDPYSQLLETPEGTTTKIHMWNLCNAIEC